MTGEEFGIIEVQQWQHFRRPVVRTKSGVYLLDHPQWLTQAGRTISVRILRGDQFAEVVEACPMSGIPQAGQDSQRGNSAPTSRPDCNTGPATGNRVNQCPICGGELQATLEDYAKQVVLSPSGELVNYEDAGCGEVRICCENDHTEHEIRRALGIE